MFISKILSYRNSWEVLNESHYSEFAEILDALPELIKTFSTLKKNSNINKYSLFRETWEDLMSQRDWKTLNRPQTLDSGQRVSLSNLGPIKNGISVAAPIVGMDLLNRWLFQQTAIANKHDIAKIPILLLPTEDFVKSWEDRSYLRTSFEHCQRQLQPLVPLSHPYPFLILGYSDREDAQEIFDLQPDVLVNDNDIVIDRCIEFPAEYHQAGLNILSFFGTYISEQYPNENAKVKIEQDGKLVRLIIESSNGKREIIEKALNEYELFVTGQKRPEDITQNQILVLEMRSELRLAKVRIESQQDIITVQNGNIHNLNETVASLMGLIGDGLRNKAAISIDFNPVITLNNSTSINLDISSILSGIGEFKQMVPSSGSEFLQLKDLEGALLAIEKEKDIEVVKSSSAINKLRKLIDNIADENSTLHKVIKATESGWDVFQNLAGKYNSIAEWCGLPQVPKVFTKG